MVRLDALSFARQIIWISEALEEVTHYDVNIFDNIVVRIRIYLGQCGFIDVFYNSDTTRMAYAFIRKEERVYGADNTGGWHIHPFENPEKHISSEEIKFEDFIKRVIKKLKNK